MKTVKSPYLRNRLTDFDETWHGDADWPPDRGHTVKISNFFKKKQDGGGRHLEKQHKSRYRNNGLAGLHEIWHDYAKSVS